MECNEDTRDELFHDAGVLDLPGWGSEFFWRRIALSLWAASAEEAMATKRPNNRARAVDIGTMLKSLELPDLFIYNE